MATGTFSQNSLHEKIQEPSINTSRKGLKNVNLAYIMLSV